jgi:hypothetical protein
MLRAHAEMCIKVAKRLNHLWSEPQQHLSVDPDSRSIRIPDHFKTVTNQSAKVNLKVSKFPDFLF